MSTPADCLEIIYSYEAALPTTDMIVDRLSIPAMADSTFLSRLVLLHQM